MHNLPKVARMGAEPPFYIPSDRTRMQMRREIAIAPLELVDAMGHELPPLHKAVPAGLLLIVLQNSK
jgi:hypothetical protein